MKIRGWIAALAAMLLLVACAAPGIPAAVATGTPGFWMGLWHGLIFPITFIISLVNHDVGVYAAVNEGNWYNFGFFLGIAMSMGGSGGSVRAASCRKRYR